MTKKVNQKLPKDEEKAQSLRRIGIIWIILGMTNPVFFILGLIFISQSLEIFQRGKDEQSLSQTGGVF